MRHPVRMTLATVGLVAIGGIAASPASAQRIHYTTASSAGQDLYSVMPNRTGFKRLTATAGPRQLDEMYPSVGGSRVLFQTRATKTAYAHVPGVTFIAVGSDYDIVEYSVVKGKGKLTLPFTQRFESKRLPAGKRYSDFGAPAQAPSGAQRVAFACRRPYSPNIRLSVTQELCVYSYATKKLQVLTRCQCVGESGAPVRLSWSRNGRYIAFASGQKIFRYDVRTKRLLTVVDGGRRSGDLGSEFYQHATISPNGNLIAVRFSRDSSQLGIRVFTISDHSNYAIETPTASPPVFTTPRRWTCRRTARTRSVLPVSARTGAAWPLPSATAATTTGCPAVRPASTRWT